MSSQKYAAATAAALILLGVYWLKRKSNESKDNSESEAVIRIGTRKSNLAMWQANHVAKALRSTFPDKVVNVLGMQTLADKDQMKPLNQFGTTGVFTKELDLALLSRRVDVAVHSLKDLPTTLPPGLVCAAVLERGELSDAVVMHAKHRDRTLATLPAGSVIGTSALRRTAVLTRRFGHLQFKSIRGNVNTRLAKLDRGDYDAIILAAVGLKRIQLGHRISQVLDAKEYGYAVGQGALAVVTREEGPHRGFAARLTHRPTLLAVEAERSMLRTLAGGCSVPIVVRCLLPASLPGKITLYGAVLSVDGKKQLVSERSAHVSNEEEARQLGSEVAVELERQGAKTLLIADNSAINTSNRS